MSSIKHDVSSPPPDPLALDSSIANDSSIAVDSSVVVGNTSQDKTSSMEKDQNATVDADVRSPSPIQNHPVTSSQQLQEEIKQNKGRTSGYELSIKGANTKIAEHQRYLAKKSARANKSTITGTKLMHAQKAVVIFTRNIEIEEAKIAKFQDLIEEGISKVKELEEKVKEHEKDLKQEPEKDKQKPQEPKEPTTASKPLPLWETATLDKHLEIEDCKVPAIHIPVTHQKRKSKSHKTSDEGLRKLIMETCAFTPTDVRGDDKQYLVTFGTTAEAKVQLFDCNNRLARRTFKPSAPLLYCKSHVTILNMNLK